MAAPGEVFRRQSETLRLKAQPVGLGRGEIDGQLHVPTLPCTAVSSNNRLEQAGAGFAGWPAWAFGNNVGLFSSQG
jgi:hypothetical protein